MLRVSGVSSRSYRSCLESELRSAAQSVVLSASALYRAWGSVGLSAIRPTSLVMTMILIGLGTGGCSLSRNDGGALAGGPLAKMDKSDVTGSIVNPTPT